MNHRVLQSFALEYAANRREPEEIIGTLFVFVMTRKHPPFVFEGMAEGNMRDVMKKRGNSNQIFIVGRYSLAAAKRFDHPMRHPGCSERVFKPSVNSGRKHQISRAKLLYTPQALEFRGIHKLHFEWAHFDVPMDGVTDEFSFAHTLYSKY